VALVHLLHTWKVLLRLSAYGFNPKSSAIATPKSAQALVAGSKVIKSCAIAFRKKKMKSA
jgi:hypothetical protein